MTTFFLAAVAVAFLVLAVGGLVVAISMLFAFRHRHAATVPPTVVGAPRPRWRRLCAVGQFFRAVINPPYNNWVWLGCVAVTIILFIVAAKVGGGEPFGLEALRKATERPPDPVEQFYHRSHSINQPLAPRAATSPLSHGSWIWWKLAVGMLLFSIIFTPIAFHDEIGTAWNRAWERWEQRRRRIRLQPQPRPIPTAATPAAGQPTTTQTIGGTLWARIKRRITEQLPGEWVGEFTYNAAERILRSIFRF